MEFGPIFRSLLRSRARVILIVAEVALTLAIVANCLSLILDTRAQLAKPSGLDDEHLIAIQATPFDDRLRDPKILDQLVEQDRRTLRAVAGVRAVSHTNLRPWERSGSITAVRVPGTRNEPARTQRAEADPGLFDTLGLPIVQGRGFTEAEYDHGGDAPLSEVQPVVVSRALAGQLYPGGNAVGKPMADADESQRFTIVGIVDHFYNPFGDSSEKTMFVPSRSVAFAYGTRLRPQFRHRHLGGRSEAEPGDGGRRRPDPLDDRPRRGPGARPARRPGASGDRDAERVGPHHPGPLLPTPPALPHREKREKA